VANIDWPVTSSPGSRIGESAGRLINAYAEPLGQGARAPIVRRRVPGLTEAASSNFFGCRALHLVGTTLLAAFSGKVASVDLTTNAMTLLGTLVGSERITIAHNNAATPNIVAVLDGSVKNLYTGSAPDAFADSDLPASVVTSVAFQSGYFFFSCSDGRIFASGLNAVTVNALDFTTAQTRPGGVTRLIPYNGELLAWGPNACDVYRNTGNASGFPYSYGDTIDKGIRGKFAIAGFDDGWVNQLIWVGDDHVVYRLDGYTAVPISTPDVVRSILTADDDELEAMVYMNGPHAMWVISGDDFTWEYNVSTGWWNERKSNGETRWKASQSIHDGDWIVGAIDSGKLFEIDGLNQTEAGEPLVFEVWSVPQAAFPARIAYPRIDIDMIVGVGEAAGTDPIETEPVAQISWSDDGGGRFSTPLLRELGGEGERRTRLTITRTGLSGPVGRQWKIVVSDPVYAAIIGGAAAAQVREA